MRRRLPWFRLLLACLGLIAATSIPSQAEAHSTTTSVIGKLHPKTHQKIVYLTFDDGPSLIYTPQILDILKREHVHATFFVLGSRVEEFPKISKRLIHEGHEVGNHGYHHDFLQEKTPAWVASDIRRTDVIVHHVIGSHAHYYRPPGGIITEPELRSVNTLGHPVVLWTVDSQDWKADGWEQIVQTVLRDTRPGSIILMHDGVSKSRYTVKALPVIIESLKNAGYQFRKLPSR
ncbi:polysaccharide deacetylase family protein [Alicyclobacillus dauci]|uniref:Polysaccharide deacetylase family protein n=1 Tax=Alicyclobacillus dauci TaxID=1475485 RepID=A0ABY6Z736_9BACL|nr:polysaccharide deacetylase family protein [Alicyclobacillus dauci]WAH38704.1 polysaccharide deacetylase family protein [Alicyclobacillus dauci]